MSAFPTEQWISKTNASVLTAILLSGCSSVVSSTLPEREQIAGCAIGQHVYFHCTTGPDSGAALCGIPGGQVLYSAFSTAAAHEVTITNDIDAQFFYNRFTRPRATHEEVSFEFEGQRYVAFSYYDADFGEPRGGLLIREADSELEGFNHCKGGATSRLAPLAEILPCDLDSALGCP